MRTARKLESKATPKRKTPNGPASEFGPARPRPRVSKKVIAERLRWVEEFVPFKPKRPLTAAEIAHAIKTGGM